MDYIGPVAVPEQTASGTFPLSADYPLAQQISPAIHVHTFGSANAKIEQRFHAGNGARRWMVRKQLTQSDREALFSFWDLRNGRSPSPSGAQRNEAGIPRRSLSSSHRQLSIDR